MLDKFNVIFNPLEKSNRLVLILKKTLLEEILKEVSGNEKELFLASLQKVNSMLTFNALSVTSYVCCLVGCTFRDQRHINYIKHLRNHHPTLKNIVCNFKKKCNRRFASIEQLIDHLKEEHSLNNAMENRRIEAVSVISKPCKCNRISCGGRHFDSIKDLMKHYTTFHRSEDRECIFSDCSTVFKSSSPKYCSNHFRLKHTSAGNFVLKPSYQIESRGISADELVSQALPCQLSTESSRTSHPIDDFPGDDVYCEANIDALENLNETPSELENSEEYYLDYYSDFLNRLAHIKFIPHTTVQEIAEEYLANSYKSLKSRERLLRDSLSKVKELSPDVIEEIVGDVEKCDHFLAAQVKLNTESKRMKHIKENKNYVGPVEIVLNKDEVRVGLKKDVIHYVPIDHSIAVLLGDSSFNEMVRPSTDIHEHDVLRDLKDGSLYKENAYFVENPEAYTIMLYSDAVEMKNPLGAARGCYKIVQVFYTLGEVDKSQRSQIDRLQLVMVFREKLLKKYSLSTIYSKLVSDLKRLEDGITLHYPTSRVVKCGVLCYAADNLEAAQVGGFSSCFSSKDICRVCHCQYADLEDNIHGDNHLPWTVREYDRIASQLRSNGTDSAVSDQDVTENNLFDLHVEDAGSASEDELDDGLPSEDEDNQIIKQRGVKSECPLNLLKSFHSVNCFVSDIMHDVFEGVIPEDLLSIIRILSSKGWFSIDQYNLALCSLDYAVHESGDKPFPVPQSHQVKKLRGKALSNWVHLRNWPLVIRNFVKDIDDEVLLLGLLLHNIVERLTAQQFYVYEVIILEEKISQYLDDRKHIREKYPELMMRPKPKHHYLRCILLAFN